MTKEKDHSCFNKIYLESICKDETPDISLLKPISNNKREYFLDNNQHRLYLELFNKNGTSEVFEVIGKSKINILTEYQNRRKSA